MDLKSVQQQLKADIAKHQVIMTQLKQNPENEALRSSLLEVQKHIAKLGTIQQQFGKLSKVSAKNNADTEAPSTENGCEDKITELQRVPAGFIKLEPESNNPMNGSVLIQSTTAGRKPIPINADLNIKNANKEKLVSTTVVSAGSSAQLVYKTVTLSIGGGNVAPRPTVRKTMTSALKLETSTTPSGRYMETQNVPSHPNVSGKDLSGPQSVAIKAAHNLSSNFMKANMQRGKLPLCPRKNVFTNSSMQLQAPSPNNGQFMLFPTCVVKPQAPAMFRFSQPKFNQQSTTKSSARFWVSVGSSPTSSAPSRYVPVTARPSDESNASTGAIQKFRLVGENGCSSKETEQVIPRHSDVTDITSSNTQLKAVLLPPNPSHVMNNSLEAADLRIEKKKIQNSLLENGVTEVTASTEVFEGDAPLVSVSPASESFNKKVSFLGCVDLVPREKAERLRNRRYGKRKAVAHPVYSGGLYVSTTAGDNSKRMLPLELFDFESEPVPVKRPRGRPRGSTNKRSLSPSQSLGGAEEIFMRILQQTKPPGASDKRKPKLEDLCVICQKAGEVLMCDTCSQVYHVTCLTPPLTAVPSGMWYCDVCKEKFNNRASAPSWPGLMAIVHSYFSFNTQREEALAKARERNRILKSKKNHLAERKRVLASILKEKVSEKFKTKENLQKNAAKCEQLTALMERVRVAVNRSLDDS